MRTTVAALLRQEDLFPAKPSLAEDPRPLAWLVVREESLRCLELHVLQEHLVEDVPEIRRHGQIAGLVEIRVLEAVPLAQDLATQDRPADGDLVRR